MWPPGAVARKPNSQFGDSGGRAQELRGFVAEARMRMKVGLQDLTHQGFQDAMAQTNSIQP